ncbi:hypothetical protein L210DRAFT_3500312 [Boletus edulis BED1]|uniref:Ubiquitin-like protease family profile domain-containing protein n=1 Tax=Boletus edulis BED1 TaxID=1328754 RepID=A0AAD4C7G0_BOLED|nr:hypothetical protein L210DRAFT_3500312 [Boletus edulis BED1]
MRLLASSLRVPIAPALSLLQLALLCLDIQELGQHSPVPLKEWASILSHPEKQAIVADSTEQVQGSESLFAGESLAAEYHDAEEHNFDEEYDVHHHHETIELAPDQRPPRRLAHRNLKANQYEKWTNMSPSLIVPYLAYLEQTLGKPVPPPVLTLSSCQVACEPKKTELIALYYDYFQPISLLLHHGLFPTAPAQPRLAVSVELLAFYQALFERLCDAGSAVQEPFRHALGRAIQWFDVLQVELDRHFESIISHCRQRITQHTNEHPPERTQNSSTASDPQFVRDSNHPDDPNPVSDRVGSARKQPHDPVTDNPPNKFCDAQLIQRCPACFGGTTFGRPLADGADIHVAIAGNFHHRHRRSSQVDAVGKRLEQARKWPSGSRRARVPDEAVDNCESTYEATDGHKQKTSMESFDDTGVMALICRHVILLFFTNIDTPRKQQKYSIALIEHLFSLLPLHATVVLLYDIGCVIDRSIGQYDIISHSIASRLRFATIAMHTYGHEWACQLVYNPRIIEGLGLTDGEGTERLWSRFIKLIGIERSSSWQHRLWLINRQAKAVGIAMLHDLGAWQKRCLKKGVHEQGKVSQKVLDTCVISISDLRSQWSEQRTAQLSIYVPARLKKELDTVLVLQAELDASNRALQTTRTAISKDNQASLALDALDSMERTHNRLLEKVQALYSSLNFEEQFPKLRGVNLDFVRILLMVRDLKINIRKRAIGSFFEWDKLDQAVGGKDKALSRRQHPVMAGRPGEQVRLGMEADNMCRWFGNELATVEVAVRLPEYHHYQLLLQQRCEDLLVLQEQWPSPLASAARCRGRGHHSHLQCRVALASTSAADNDGEMDLLDMETSPADEEQDIAPEQLQLGDVLTGIYDDDDDKEEEKDIDVPIVRYLWDLQHPFTKDSFDLITPPTMVPEPLANCARPPISGFTRIDFETKDLQILASREACLNDICLNGCAALLYSTHVAQEPSQFAVFSTHDLLHIRYNAADEDLWRSMAHTKYWEKPIWILPIHRASSWGHWSWGDVSMEIDVLDIITLVTHLCTIAHAQRGAPLRHAGQWVTVPITTTALQTNAVDCGLWVLAQIVAIFRGCQATGFEEHDMMLFRRYLLFLALNLPIAST